MSGALSWEERILTSRDDYMARERLLNSRGLSVPGGEDFVIGLFSDEQLVATGSLVGSILEGIAVDESVEGEGAGVAIVSSLIQKAVASGRTHLSLFTKDSEVKVFEAMGFHFLASTGHDGAALLEWEPGGIREWLAAQSSYTTGKPDNAGAIVINGNPFTLGHRKLIEYAAARVPWLYVFIVEEDRSLFPFSARFELATRGCADIPNVSVLKGGPYIISAASFPSYFIRPQKGDTAGMRAVELHAELDITLFRRYIAPAFRVTDRFVGTEPYCATTSVYNRVMKEILMAPEGPDGGGKMVRVRELPRIERQGIPVSASRVRELLRGGDVAATRPFLPDTTWEWLASPAAAPVLEKIKKSDSPH